MPKVTKVGVVTSNKMAKSVVVSVERLVRHPLYLRSFKKTSTFMAHDEDNRCQIGDRVRIEECRPLSRRKRWKVVDVLRREPVAEPLPKELAEPAGA